MKLVLYVVVTMTNYRTKSWKTMHPKCVAIGCGKRIIPGKRSMAVTYNNDGSLAFHYHADCPHPDNANIMFFVRRHQEE